MKRKPRERIERATGLTRREREKLTASPEWRAFADAIRPDIRRRATRRPQA
jgi:hypothetical protein